MFRPTEFSYEIEVLVDTFIIRWGVRHDVAKKLARCSPEIQWQVISSKAPRRVHNPNGFVMGRIARAINTFRDLPLSHGCSAGSSDQPIRDASNPKKGHKSRQNSPVRSSARVILIQAKSLDMVEVSES